MVSVAADCKSVTQEPLGVRIPLYSPYRISSAGEQCVDNALVTGSIPVSGTKFGGIAQWQSKMLLTSRLWVRLPLPLPNYAPFVYRSRTLPFHGRKRGSIPLRCTILFQCSSAVEQLTVNQLVVGSIPATGARTVAEWSRGSLSVSYAEGRWFDSILRNQ